MQRAFEKIFFSAAMPLEDATPKLHDHLTMALSDDEEEPTWEVQHFGGPDGPAKYRATLHSICHWVTDAFCKTHFVDCKVDETKMTVDSETVFVLLAQAYASDQRSAYFYDKDVCSKEDPCEGLRTDFSQESQQGMLRFLSAHVRTLLMNQDAATHLLDPTKDEYRMTLLMSMAICYVNHLNK